MKIVFVNHTFPPESCAGSELCVLNLAIEYQQRGHDVAVFYRISEPERDEYAIQEDEYEDIQVCRINRTYRFVDKFQDIYLDPIVAVRFAAWLRAQRADVVHFHHLTNLSLSLVHEAKQIGCTAIMTLHDYWLLCQRGQLLRPGLVLCNGPSPAACRACLAPQLLRGRAQRIASRFQSIMAGGSEAAPMMDLLNLRHASLVTPNPEFVQRTTFGLSDAAGETLLTHPPAQVTYRLALNRPARFRSAIAMHPSTYEQSGGGVRFFVERNGKELFSQLLRPKQVASDRNWREVEIELAASHDPNDSLTLATEAEDGEGAFCAAGWRAPRIESMAPLSKALNHPIKPSAKKIIKSALGTLFQPFVHLFSEAHEGISHRRHWVQRVFDEVDLFISPSHFLRDFFIRHGLPPDKIIYSDNGFPTPPPTPRKSPQATLRFGYIGTWIPSKGVDLAIQAFQDMDPSKAQLWVYGFFPGYDGYDQYEHVLRSMAGPAVIFKGRYVPSEVYSILHGLDCLIMPSIWWENSPMTMHEAFQAGVPLITADAGGMAEQVRNGGGLTFRMRDAASLRAVVRRVINSPSILNELRATIPAVKSIAEHADELLHLYEHASYKGSPQ